MTTQPAYTPDEWRSQAACARQGIDTDAFYPETYTAQDTRYAKHICQDCPVRTQCLEEALRLHDEYGIWGGMTPTERRNTLRARMRRTHHRIA